MGYYDSPTQPKRQPTEPPPFDPNTPGATEPPPFVPSQAPPAQQAPMAGNYEAGPAMPSEVPAGMTLSGLRDMLDQRAGQGRPMGGYYAPQFDSKALAAALMAVRQNNTPRR
jgi:hypothetical protein